MVNASPAAYNTIEVARHICITKYQNTKRRRLNQYNLNLAFPFRLNYRGIPRQFRDSRAVLLACLSINPCNQRLLALTAEEVLKFRVVEGEKIYIQGMD
jgi:hypothetical protein